MIEAEQVVINNPDIFIRHASTLCMDFDFNQHGVLIYPPLEE
jgi:hypothetical protein